MATDKLTDVAVKKAKPGARPVRMSDGGGMFLALQPTGGKWWRLKYRFEGKEKLLSLGTYPEVSLSEARARRAAARKLLSHGVDPSAAGKSLKGSRGDVVAESFEAVAREFHKLKADEWSGPHATRWLERFEKDVFPWLGSLALPVITAPMLLQTPASSRGTRRARNGSQHSPSRGPGVSLRGRYRTVRAQPGGRPPWCFEAGSHPPCERDHGAKRGG